ncbi:hypothetical protein [Salsuginibacillus kocurii]|uniref:hypothetical protein n=1 Tax=Salsuginibacillus kocurii TaxID=427078 RepID=UPI0003779884|nr:hypothetical protein [Salsuginibacillus kocurii]
MTIVTQQVGRANINLKKLTALPAPLPPEEDIKTISSLLDNYFISESQIRELISLQKNIKGTKQSILSQAFRGKLGTNDSTEKSAV